MGRLIYTYAATLLSLGFLIALFLCINALQEICYSLDRLIEILGGLKVG